jgi:hypothetical protein
MGEGMIIGAKGVRSTNLEVVTWVLVNSLVFF